MKKDELKQMIGWERNRLIEFIRMVPEELMDFEASVKQPKVDHAHSKVRSIIQHIIDGENDFIIKILSDNPYPKEELLIVGKSKEQIIAILEKVRARSLEWLDANEGKLDELMKESFGDEQKYPYWMMYYWTASHDSCHIGQLIMLMTIAGFDVGWL
jgi:uncharacterized damage-inducible protein DinB